MNPYDPQELKTALSRLGFRFSKGLGQNFLISQETAREIAGQAADDPQTGILEIGPGPGSLTVQLAPLYEHIVCVELDGTLLPLLEENLAGAENVRIISGDILKMDLPALVRDEFGGSKPAVCSNLPYSITTPVLTALLRSGCFSRITVMVQKEVAGRICASPGGKDYGSFTVLCRYYADCEILFDVAPACFLPQPKVTSSVIRLTPHPKPAEVENEKDFFRVVRAAFGQRRKTLYNALSAGLAETHTKEDVKEAIQSCGFPEDIRGERLSLEDFAALAKALFPAGEN